MIPKIVPKCLWFETPTDILFTVIHKDELSNDVMELSINNNSVYFESIKHKLNITLTNEIDKNLSSYSTSNEKTFFKLIKIEKKMWKNLTSDTNLPNNWLSVDWDLYNGNDESDFSNSDDENNFHNNQFPPDLDIDDDDDNNYEKNDDDEDTDNENDTENNDDKNNEVIHDDKNNEVIHKDNNDTYNEENADNNIYYKNKQII